MGTLLPLPAARIASAAARAELVALALSAPEEVVAGLLRHAAVITTDGEEAPRARARQRR